MKESIFAILISLLGLNVYAHTLSPIDSTKYKQIKQFNVGNMRVTIEEDADSSMKGSGTTDSPSDKGSVGIKIEEEPTRQHTRKFKKRTFYIPEYWGGLCIGTNGYLSASGSTKLPVGYDFLELNQGKSASVALNFEGFRFNLYQRKLHLVTGFGFEWNNFRFTSDQTLDSDSNQVSAFASGLSYSKNKLTASYLTVPLLVGYNTNPRSRKHFFLAGGLVGGLNIGAHSKQVFDIKGKTFKNKVEDDFNLAPFRCDATVRFGYRRFTLFANYSLSALFRSGRGPELHPFSIGVKLL